MNPLIQKIKDAGVVGAGGAGFPAYMKYNAQAEFVLANGAECEPLLYKDKELMRLFPNEVKRGMEIVTELVGAQRTILGIKAKNSEVIGQFKGLFGGTKNEIFEMGDYYPAGDEYVLIYEAVGRLVPYGGYPVHIGCVVSNVETLLNVALAESEKPVTEKFITITGAVKNPMTLKVPIGCTLGDLIELAGGTTTEKEIAALDGGAMMGKLVKDLETPITKVSAGFIVLPVDHTLVRRRSETMSEMKRIGQSACDQCTYCTEFCPRYLLGYEIEPHKVMRSLGFAGEKDDFWGKYALNCCECNLCSLYACPEDLDPKQACVRSKTNVRLKKLEFTPPDRELGAHPMQEHRKVSIGKLTRKLGLMPYNHPAEFKEIEFHPKKVTLPLKQHIGAECIPKVMMGEEVFAGQMIADVPDGAMGVPIHASIHGVVVEIGNNIVIEAK